MESWGVGVTPFPQYPNTFSFLRKAGGLVSEIMLESLLSQSLTFASLCHSVPLKLMCMGVSGTKASRPALGSGQKGV